MPENHLFEYAVIRIVPRVDREEFLNAGVILYCPKLKFLQIRFVVNEERVRAFCHKIDLDELKNNLLAFEHICAGKKDAGPIALLDLPSRFRWLTATRSTVLQSSKVHPGFCIDPLETLNKLFEQLVL
ncbi:DUF3037 domain-containing protein [Ferruginibacter sp. HRS2-29]|uniref:DUF3037 domain-containing protein n=1 Tax=Ferruginibacter sp. HRS2-29 TaxID=2487334 RepID=UPI0020CF6343|nr:DUF3037 domain-containing protein [Ferruginibacter sp. HRS2-29]MCP9751364.1 DUF3037 domain-containing protein [Ferruginibacter sp. HRS2-29]